MATTAEEMERRWDEFLEEASLGMTPATFDSWLRGSRVLALEGDVLVVGVVHGGAAEWIEKRMLPAQGSALDRHFPGLAVQVRPLQAAGDGNGQGPAPGGRDRPAGEPAGEDDEAVEFDAVTDPALARFDVSLAGWSKLANYALDFWAELLGPVAFMTWLVIRHEDIRRTKTAWTPTMSYSVSHLAALAAGGNRQAITGVWRTCHAASIVKHDKPCARCAERGGQVVEPHVCRYWRPGALDRLHAEGIANVERRGEGRSTVYRVRVFTLLPLLTPAQVADLGPVSQQRHSRWLLRQNLDPASWESLTVRHLALPAL